MKRLIPDRPVVTALLAVALLLLLSTCSGVIGGDNMVRISVPGIAASGRFISGSGDLGGAANSGFVVVLQENKVYSLNNFSDKAYQALVNGNVYIANLPVGTYIFGVVLMNDMGTADEGDDVNVGLAIKERKVKAGFNDFLIDVGPGISFFEIDNVPFEDFFTPKGYTSRFADDTIILDIVRNPVEDYVDLIFNGGGTTVGSEIVGGVAVGGGGGGGWDIDVNWDGVETITTGLTPDISHEYKLSIILE